MPLYRTTGIKNSKATVANFGERVVRWSGSYKEAQKDRKDLKALGFDVVLKRFPCPKDKKSLLALLNMMDKN